MRLEKKAVSITVLMLLLSYMLVLAVNIQSVTAEDGIFYVRADGAVEPSTAPILGDGDIYRFAGDIFGSIVVERSNIIVDGNGYLLKGSRSINGFQLDGVNNVTIQNVKIQNFSTAISFNNSSYNTVSGNDIVDNDHGINIYGSVYNTISRNNIADNYLRGIEIYESSEFNIISENNITNSKQYAISLYDCAYNRIFHNNIINNTNQIRLSSSSSKWDDGYPSGGNYLSDYTGTDNDGDGIGDTPYIIDENNQDNYPLMEPVIIPEFPTWTTMLLMLIVPAVALAVYK
jgi:parallel beta-helix repeat protein